MVCRATTNGSSSGISVALARDASRVGSSVGLGDGEKCFTGGREFGVEAPLVLSAQNPRQQRAILESGDQTCRRAAGQRGGTCELLHTHVPTVLASSAHPARCTPRRKVGVRAGGPARVGFDLAVERGKGAPAA